MVIQAKDRTNFLAYLRSFPQGAVLISSIRGNQEPAQFFGGPSQEILTEFEYVLQYQGISVHYRFKSEEGNPFDCEDAISRVVDEFAIPIIPVEEGDSVTF